MSESEELDHYFLENDFGDISLRSENKNLVIHNAIYEKHIIVDTKVKFHNCHFQSGVTVNKKTIFFSCYIKRKIRNRSKITIISSFIDLSEIFNEDDKSRMIINSGRISKSEIINNGVLDITGVDIDIGKSKMLSIPITFIKGNGRINANFCNINNRSMIRNECSGIFRGNLRNILDVYGIINQ